MTDQTPPPPADETPDRLRERIKELERQVVSLRFERDNLKEFAYPLLMKDLPEEPPMTEEEAVALINGPRTDVRVLWDIIEKHEREYLAEGGDGR